MSIAVIISIFMLSIMLFCLTSCNGESKSVNITRNQSRTVNVGDMKTLSKKQIEEMLENIESRAKPKVKMGAMCYKMAAPPDRAEYNCPVCGDKTLYTAKRSDGWNSLPSVISRQLPTCRRLIEQIKKNADLSIDLNETSFCKKCSPNAAKHTLELIVTYPDGTVHKIEGITDNDLRILLAFFKGDLYYKTSNDAQLPLKNALPRLRELLGTKLQQPKK